MPLHAFEHHSEGIPENLQDAITEEVEAEAPDSAAAHGSRTAAEAQAQRESYLKKGEDLIHSLL